MTWKTIDAVNTTPANQWQVTQSNSTPIFGRNAVNNSVNIETAIIQWKARATSECLGMRAGRSAAGPGDGLNSSALAKYRTKIAWTTTKASPAIAATQI